MGQGPLAHSHGGIPHTHAVGQHSRRRFLTNALGVVGVAWLPGLGLAACTSPQPGAPTPAGSTPPPPTGGGTATATKILYRDGAFADARSATLRQNVSIFVEGGRVNWIRPKDGEGDVGKADDVWVIDCVGSTIVPGLVDAHSHASMAGGANNIDSALAPVPTQFRQAEEAARRNTLAGVRYYRDVGSPRVKDPETGQERAISLILRDRWKGRREYPIVRAAGTWLNHRSSAIPEGVTLKAATADELLRNAQQQLDEGADLLKIYLNPPDENSPWTAAELKPVIDLAKQRNARVAAHAADAASISEAVAAGVSSIEHGTGMTAESARAAAQAGIFLVPTLAAVQAAGLQAAAWQTPNDAKALRTGIDEAVKQYQAAVEGHVAAGVRLAAGSDFGGSPIVTGSLAREIELLAGAGLQPWQALAAATWQGGELLGVPEAGVLSEGGPADLILVEGDPLSDIAAMSRVWHVSWVV